MDNNSSRPDNKESKLQSDGQSSKPDIMQLQYLKEITNDFSDERILGRGGFGVVYKGVRENGEMVAIKKLLQPMPNFLKQFKNEVDLLVRLKHPNIVQLIGYCYETQHVHMDHKGKFIFAEMTQSLLCLEYLPKGSLDGFISDESYGLDWRTRYTIIEGICNGLQYLHGQIKPIIHLDLKPSNILLTDNMVPKVTDFGLSRLLDEQQTMCTLITNGTRGYMPPEYIQGGIITPMSDIFSLGVIILELVTGHRDYPDITRTSSEDFIELTLKKWSDVLEKAPGYTSLEVDCQQIKNCIQIGLMCVNPERTKRPTAAKVIKMIQGLESMDCHGGSEVTSPASQRVSGPRELLDIYPLELCFSSDPNNPCLVKLTNKTDKYVAFHFKAIMAINNYCIEPSSGFMWPRSLLNVVVTMEEPCELPRDFRCHNEFLVQSIIVSMERLVSEHITEDTFNKVSSKAVQKVNLAVVYEPPSQPPPLLRVGSEGTETTNLQQLEGFSEDDAEEEALKDDVYTAAAYGDLEKLQRLVEVEGRLVVEPDDLGYHALQWATLNNRTAVAQYILEHGADVNAVDHTGQTALHWSSVRGHVQVADLLLQEGAKLDAPDLYGYQVHSNANALAVLPDEQKKPNIVTVTSSKTQKLDLTCKVCGVTSTSQKSMQDHLEGKTHKRKVTTFLQPMPEEAPSNANVSKDSSILSAAASGNTQKLDLTCTVCGIPVTSETAMEEHLKGKAHRKKAATVVPEEAKRRQEEKEEEAEDVQGEKEEEGSYTPNKFHLGTNDGAMYEVIQMNGSVFCEVCNVSTPDLITMVCHLQGTKHISKARQKAATPPATATIAATIADGDPQTVALRINGVPHTVRRVGGLMLCELCDVKVPSASEGAMRSHLSGKMHTKKTEGRGPC